jgi:hypothetical protein
MSIAPDTEVAGPVVPPPAPPEDETPAAVEAAPTEDDATKDDATVAAEPEAEPASPVFEAVGADSDDDCFRRLADALDPDSLAADQIQRALEQELDSETLLDRLTEALADEGAADAELRDAAPALAVITIRSLVQALGIELPEPKVRSTLTRTAAETALALIETGIPGAIGALPNIARRLAHRAARDRIGGAALIPALRRIAERVAFDPDLVRRLSGREALSRPPATAAYGAAAFRQQPMRCRIDGPVEIIIVRR